MITCMTCSRTASLWGTWEDDPRKAMSREIEWETRYRGKNGMRLYDELLAIASLIDAHNDEFIAAINEIEQRRIWNANKEARKASKRFKPRTKSL